MQQTEVMETLARAGFLNPDGEAELLLEAAARQRVDVRRLLGRRVEGEPLPWIVGSTTFCETSLSIDPGVFVPRTHTEALARRAAELLPDSGVALDLCTGCGAVAVVMARARPKATIVATDMDPVAVACAERNGIGALLGDLDAPVPTRYEGKVDVVTAVVPYVPWNELQFLLRDVLTYEPRIAIDGGERGTEILRRVVVAAPRWLRAGGAVLLELGGNEASEISELLASSGFTGKRIHRDEDGQARFIEAYLGA